jgi:hypothetical protein
MDERFDPEDPLTGRLFLSDHRSYHVVLNVPGRATQGSNKTGAHANEPGQAAEEVHEDVAEKVVAQVVEAVQQQVTEAVQQQGGQAARLQEKVEQIVMEKIAEAVQKKAEEVKSPEPAADAKKEVL